MSNRLEEIRVKLTRDPKTGWLGGVCAGAARYFNIDPAYIRVGVVIAAVPFTKLTIAAYIIAWILMSERDDRLGD